MDLSESINIPLLSLVHRSVVIEKHRHVWVRAFIDVSKLDIEGTAHFTIQLALSTTHLGISASRQPQPFTNQGFQSVSGVLLY